METFRPLLATIEDFCRHKGREEAGWAESVREKIRGAKTGSFTEETGYVTQHQTLSV